MTSQMDIAVTVFKCFRELKPLLQDIFPDITDDELKRIKIKELVPLFYDICKNIADDIKLLSRGIV